MTAFFLVLGGALLFAGGKGGGGGTSASKPLDPSKPYAGTVLRWAASATSAGTAETVKLIALVEEKTGIIIAPQIYPDLQDGTVDRTLVGIMAGDAIDIIYFATPNLKPYYNAGVLTDVGELAAKQNYDIKGIYGDFLPVFGGKAYGLPAFSDIWLTLYNKSVFDEKGLPYPSAEGWTWEKYIETAQKLNDPGKGIYGSLMLDYDCYEWMYGVQKGAAYYKDARTSNFDDPRFKEGLKWYFDLGNVLKIQPTYVDVHSTRVPWDAFGSQTPYRYGMFVCGGWTTYLMDKKNYPRDWKFGILPMPYPEGQKPSTLVVPGCYAIPTTSRNKEAALAAVACIAENQYTLGAGRVPARRDLSEAELNRYITGDLAKPFAGDGVTPQDFIKAWFDPNRASLDEKPIGPGDAAFKTIWVEEGSLYAIGQKSLDAAMGAIKTRSDQAIKDSGE
jgi:multiple sugar transport system substrate-binding protein